MRAMILFFSSLSVIMAQTHQPAAPERAKYFRSADGTVLAYFEKGAGPVLVLLAGGYGYSHKYLSPVGDGLAAANRVVLLDQRGTGLSKLRKHNASTLNVDRLVEDLEALRLHLGLPKLRLLGHSWGGMLAMSYAAAHPERVESMVLVSSGGMDMGFSGPYNAGVAARLKEVLSVKEQERLKRLMSRLPATKIEISHLRMPAYVYDRSRASELEKYFDHEPDPPHEIAEDLNARKWNVRQAMRDLQAPVLIVHGREDPLPLSVAEETQGTISGARIEVIEHCGHYPWVDQPDLFFEVIKSFR